LRADNSHVTDGLIPCSSTPADATNIAPLETGWTVLTGSTITVGA